MKKNVYHKITFLFLLIVSFSSCTATREQEVEDEMSSFRTWVSEQSSTIATKTEEDWKRAKADFEVRTAELDQRQEQFSDELKEEYQQLKTEFNELEEQRVEKQREAKLVEWETNLLGSYADKTTITQQNVREVYTQFLEKVRTLKGQWTDEDWEMAKLVMESLNERKDEVDNGLATEDEVKIKALQMEFKTLETANDVSGDN